MPYNLLGEGGMANFLTTGGGGSSGIWFYIIIVCYVLFMLFLFGVAAWYFSPMFLYPYICPIQGLRNGVLKYLGQGYGKDVSITSSGRDVTKFKLWRMFKKAEYIEPVPNEYKVSYSKKKDMINLFQDNSGNLRPLQIVLNPRTQQEILQPNDKDVDFWMINEINSAVSSYIKQPKYLQYLPIIVSAVFIAAIFIFLLILTKQFGELINQIGSLVNALTAVFPK